MPTDEVLKMCQPAPFVLAPSSREPLPCPCHLANLAVPFPLASGERGCLRGGQHVWIGKRGKVPMLMADFPEVNEEYSFNSSYWYKVR